MNSNVLSIDNFILKGGDITMTDAELLAAYKAKDAKRKLQVKKYFGRRNVRFDVYKRFFDAKATEADRKALETKLSSL